MRIDLPCCGFKNCRYQLDGNCISEDKHDNCEYHRLIEQHREWIPCTEDTKLDEPKECWATMSDGKVSRLYYRPEFAPFPWTSIFGTFTYGNKDIVAYIPIEEPKPYRG